MVLKLSSLENPQRAEKSSKKYNTEPKMVQKMWFRTIFGSIKNLFGLVFRTFSRGLKKEFFTETSEMVLGNLKSQEGSLLNQNIQMLPWTTYCNALQLAKMGKLQKHVQRVKWQNQTEQRAFSHLFNGTTKISTSITKSWSEVTPLL